MQLGGGVENAMQKTQKNAFQAKNLSGVEKAKKAKIAGCTFSQRYTKQPRCFSVNLQFRHNNINPKPVQIILLWIKTPQFWAPMYKPPSVFVAESLEKNGGHIHG